MLMRAAAVALVLILGAAVVLWYANTLNSWVLGGLIGGLAALLLSIPISLTLFSYLSRRHEERLKAETQEEMSQANLEAYEDYLEAPVEVYDADGYLLPSAEEEWQKEEDTYRMQRGIRNLPVPVSQPRLPVARRKQSPEHLAPRQSQRSTEYPLVPERQPRPTPQKGATGRPPAPSRQMRYPGFPGYQVSGQRSAYHTAALRVARQEAAAQHADDTEVLSTGTSRKLPAMQPPQDLTASASKSRSARTSRQLPLQPEAPTQYRPRRTIEGSSVPPASRTLPGAGESSANPTTGKHARRRDIGTDQFGGYFPETEPVHRQMQTGQTVRNPRIDAQPRNSDMLSGSLKNPLVRRAPYMYEDDPLRQELAQQIEAPQVRRSSRYLDYDEEEE